MAEDRARGPRVSTRRSWARTAIRLLVAANVIVLWLFTWLAVIRPGGPGVERAVRELEPDLEIVAALVERHRDAAGLVPQDLTAVLPQLPPEVARHVQRGVIRYLPSPDRRTFRLTVWY